MQPEAFDSRDLREVEAFVSRIYSKMRIGSVGRSTRAQITRRIFAPGIGFDELEYGFEIDYVAEPQGLLIICEVVSNTIRSDDDLPGDTFGPGDQFLFSRPDRPYSGVARSTRLRFTLIDPAILTVVAASSRQDTDPQPPVRLLDHRPVSRQAQLQLQRCIAHVRDELMSEPDTPPAPLLVSSASHYLAASVLHTYPNTAVDRATEQAENDPPPSTVGRAVDFIEANPDVGLTVADIARAAYVSPRGLQLAFRHHLGTTPMAHLRRVRLEQARDDLRAATAGDGRTVTGIAARWGLTSSRFSLAYRTAFGELPSETLRN